MKRWIVLFPLFLAACTINVPGGILSTIPSPSTASVSASSPAPSLAPTPTPYPSLNPNQCLFENSEFGFIRPTYWIDKASSSTVQGVKADFNYNDFSVIIDAVKSNEGDTPQSNLSTMKAWIRDSGHTEKGSDIDTLDQVNGCVVSYLAHVLGKDLMVWWYCYDHNGKKYSITAGFLNNDTTESKSLYLKDLGTLLSSWKWK